MHTETPATPALPRITADWLKEHNACAEGVSTFLEQWPDGADITATNLREAVNLDMDLAWFVLKILDKDQQYRFHELVDSFVNRDTTYDQDRCDALIVVLGLSDAEGN